MRKIFFVCFYFCSFALFAQTTPAPIKIASSVEKVMVFLRGAQVQRTAKIDIQSGKREYLISGLSPNLNQQSLQVKGEGDFTILSVVQRQNYLSEKETEQRETRLTKQMDSLKTVIDKENVNAVVLNSEIDLLDKMQNVQNKEVMPKPSEITENLVYRKQKLTELKLESLEIVKRIEKAKEDYNKLYLQVVEANVKKNAVVSELTVTILAKNATTSKLEISYFVENAGWQPFYDFRVKDISTPMQLSYKANVYQNTGEDWKEVKLTLSNANPYQKGDLPDFRKWNLKYKENNTRVIVKGYTEDHDNDGVPDVFDKSPDMAEADSFGVYGRSFDSDDDGFPDSKDKEPFSPRYAEVDNYGVAVNRLKTIGEAKEQARLVVEQKTHAKESTPLAVTLRTQQTSFSYDIAEPYTVIADNKLNLVEIKQWDVPVQYQYYSVPKIEESAFLLALIKDWEQYNLLEGEAQLFFEGTFVGKSQLRLQNLGDTLTVSLGRDKNIIVKRTPLRKNMKKQFLGNQRTDTREFEIAVRNTKKQAIDIWIEDQLPVSSNKEILVEKLEIGQGEVKAKTDIIRWQLNVNSNEQKVIPFKYQVKYPANWAVDLE
jgi:hypothetical protein